MTSQIYVGTYAKYNNGNLAGEWLELDNFSDKQDFIAACLELHKDESDPELMFQDFEEVPDGMVSESHIDEQLWEWVALDEHDRTTVSVYRGHVDQSASIEQAIESLIHHEPDGSKADAMEAIYCDTHDLSHIPAELLYAIDWDIVARDSGYTFVELSYKNVFVFNN